MRVKTWWSKLTEEISGLLCITDQWWAYSKLVLSHDSELILMVLSQPGYHIGTLFGIIGDMDPGFPVLLALLNHVVGDLRSTVIDGRAPGEAYSFCKHLRELDWSNWGTGRPYIGREAESYMYIWRDLEITSTGDQTCYHLIIKLLRDF